MSSAATWTRCEAGDADAIVNTFAPDGYFREPMGPNATHRGTAELRSFFATQFTTGGIGLQRCAVTDDGVRCALEYNCIRWGTDDLPAQAGLAVYERGADGLLAAVRIYDDVEAPSRRQLTPERTSRRCPICSWTSTRNGEIVSAGPLPVAPTRATGTETERSRIRGHEAGGCGGAGLGCGPCQELLHRARVAGGRRLRHQRRTSG